MNATRGGTTLSMLANMVGPYLGFRILRGQGWTEVGALTAVTIIPLVWGLVVLVRKRRLDLIATMSATGMVLSLVACALSSDVRALQIRDSYVTLLFGLVFLGSAVLRRPVLTPMIQAQIAAQTNPKRKAGMQAWLGSPRGRSYVVFVTLVWGLVFLAEFSLKLWLIFTLPMATVLAVSPWILNSIVFTTIAWSVWYGKREGKRARALAAAASEQLTTPELSPA